MASVALMIEHVHSREYVYRDLKPENVMVGADGFLKLVDFGFCKRLPAAEQTFTACGTVEYMAPEIVNFKGHGHEVDWWAAGVLLYECLHGYTPFTDEGTTDSEMVRKPLHSLRAGATTEYRGVRLCLEPRDRPSTHRDACGLS